MSGPEPNTENASQSQDAFWSRVGFLAIVLLVALATYVLFKRHFDFEVLAQQEQALKSFYRSYPLVTLTCAFTIYAIVTGLAIPGATPMSLVMSWFFGFTTALVLISFASTTGALIAFLVSRYLFQDWIHARFDQRITAFNDTWEKEGAFYLFSLRLVPLIPFFMINSVMGLTKIPARTFWWVSQIGMLPGTAMICFMGAGIPGLQVLEEKGTGAILNSELLTRMTIGLALLGTFPIIVKKLLSWHKSRSIGEST